VVQVLGLVGGLEHEFYFSIQLGMASSQLTNPIIFQRGRSTTRGHFFGLSIDFMGEEYPAGHAWLMIQPVPTILDGMTFTPADMAPSTVRTCGRDVSGW
jgi:hypothetical protein